MPTITKTIKRLGGLETKTQQLVNIGNNEAIQLDLFDN